jgi:hypothetical protein
MEVNFEGNKCDIRENGKVAIANADTRLYELKLSD